MKHFKIIITLAFIALFVSSSFAYRYRTCDGSKLRFQSNQNMRLSRDSFPEGHPYRTVMQDVINYFNKHAGDFYFSVRLDESEVSLSNSQNEMWFSDDDDILDGAPAVCYSRWNCYDAIVTSSKKYKTADIIYDIGVPYAHERTKSLMTSYGGPRRPLRTTATHELGHAIGLLHVSDRYNSMGQSWTHIHANGDLIQQYPGEDTSNGAAFLYSEVRPDVLEDVSVTHWKWAGRSNGEYSVHERTTLMGLNHRELAKQMVNGEPVYWVDHASTFLVEFTHENTGTRQYDTRVGYYLSEDNLITTRDRRLGGLVLPDRRDNPSLREFTITLPDDLRSDTTYYIGVIVDEFDNIEEYNETNNATYTAIHIRPYTPTPTPTATATATLTPTWDPLTPTPTPDPFQYLDLDFILGHFFVHPLDMVSRIDAIFNPVMVNQIYALDSSANLMSIYDLEGSSSQLTFSSGIANLNSPHAAVEINQGQTMLIGGSQGSIQELHLNPGSGKPSMGDLVIPPGVEETSTITKMVATLDSQFIYASVSGSSDLYVYSNPGGGTAISLIGKISLFDNSILNFASINQLNPLGSEAEEEELQAYIPDFVISKDGNYLYVLAGQEILEGQNSPSDMEILQFSINQKDGTLELQSREFQSNVDIIRLSSNGKFVVTASSIDGQLNLWQIDEKLGSLKLLSSSIHSELTGLKELIWEPHSRYLYGMTTDLFLAIGIDNNAVPAVMNAFSVKDITGNEGEPLSMVLSKQGDMLFAGISGTETGTSGIATLQIIQNGVLEPTPTKLPVKGTPTPTMRPVKGTPTPTATPLVAAPTPVPGMGIELQGNIFELQDNRFTESVKPLRQTLSLTKMNGDMLSPEYRLGYSSGDFSSSPISLPNGDILTFAYGEDMISKQIISIDAAGVITPFATEMNPTISIDGDAFSVNYMSVHGMTFTRQASIQLLVNISGGNDDNTDYFELTCVITILGPFEQTGVEGFTMY